MVKIYHGAKAGWQNAVLGDLIENGASSAAGSNMWDQRDGLFVSIHPGVAKLFGGNRHEIDYAEAIEFFERTPKELLEENDPEKIRLMKCGWGMVAEFDVTLDAVNWDFDHEMGYGANMKLLHQLRDYLPHLATPTPEYQALLEDMHRGLCGKIPTEEYDRFFEGQPPELHPEIEFAFQEIEKGGFILNRPLPDYPYAPTKPMLIAFPWPVPIDRVAHRTNSCLLDKIHGWLSEQFPHEYTEAKQSIFAEMEAEGRGIFKYVGEEPLRPSKIYMRTENTPPSLAGSEQPFEGWDVAYESFVSKTKKPEPNSPTQSPSAKAR